MSKVVAASLGKTKATTILYQLTNVTTRYLLFSNNFQGLAKLLLQENPTHVLLLGLCPRGKKIKIEQECLDNNTTYTIPHYFEANDSFTFAETIGTGRCNFHTAQVLQFLRDNLPTTRLTFLHIPKQMNVSVAATEITNQLASL